MLLTNLLLVANAGFAIAGPAKVPKPDADGKYTLEAPGIRAQFIPFAASITNLFVKDKNGIERDIVLGYDKASQYENDPYHPNYGAVPGRYANRIGDATFEIDGKRYYTQRNDGNNTLHSGTNGWSYRTWETTKVSKNSITFSIYDADNSTAMPGRVNGKAIYTLKKNAWHVRLEAESLDTLTPLMLTQHTYFNLDAYANPSTDLILDHTYHTPYSTRMLANRGDMVPTGELPTLPRYDINDFWSSPKPLGANITSPLWVGNCGTASGCGGYNNLWIVDKPTPKIVDGWKHGDPTFILKSEWSGISVKGWSNQEGIQIYTCYWNPNGVVPIKKTQGLEGREGYVNSNGCIAIEYQDWNDGINHPEWGRKQFYGPGETYVWEAIYRFEADSK